jgi:hypothetical protein
MKIRELKEKLNSSTAFYLFYLIYVYLRTLWCKHVKVQLRPLWCRHIQ